MKIYQSPVHAVFPQRFPHRHVVLGRNIALYIVHSGKNEAPARSEIIYAAAHFVLDFLGRAVWQNALRIHAAAPKGKPVADLLF